MLRGLLFVSLFLSSLTATAGIPKKTDLTTVFLNRWNTKIGPVLPKAVADFSKQLNGKNLSRPIFMPVHDSAAMVGIIEALSESESEAERFWFNFRSYRSVKNKDKIYRFKLTDDIGLAFIPVSDENLVEYLSGNPFSEYKQPHEGVIYKPVIVYEGDRLGNDSKSLGQELFVRLYRASVITVDDRDYYETEKWNTLARALRRSTGYQNGKENKLENLITNMARQMGGAFTFSWSYYDSAYLVETLRQATKESSLYDLKVETLDVRDLYRSRQVAGSLGANAVLGGKLNNLLNTGKWSSDGSVGTSILYINRRSLYRQDEGDFEKLVQTAIQRLQKYSKRNPEHNIRIVIEDVSSVSSMYTAVSTIPAVVWMSCEAALNRKQ